MKPSHVSRTRYQRWVLSLGAVIAPVALALLVFSVPVPVALVQAGTAHEAGAGVTQMISPTGRFEPVLTPGSGWGSSIPFVSQLAPDGSGVLFASIVDSDPRDWILRSADGGYTWDRVQMPLPSSTFPLVVSPDFVHDQTVFALIQGDLYKSVDGGDHWTALPVPPITGTGYSRFVKVSPNYAVDHAVFIGMYVPYGSGGVYSSTNEGQAWTLVTGGAARAPTDLAFSPGYPDDPTMFVVSYNDGILRSDDGGATWIPLADPQFSPDFRIALSPAYKDDYTLFAVANGISNGGAFSSTSRGDSWHEIRNGSYSHAVAVSPKFAQDRTVMVADDQGGVALSEDAGATWFAAPELPRLGSYGQKYSFAFAIENGALVPLVSTHTTIYRYRWPSVLSRIFLPLEPGTTGSVTRAVALKPDLEARTPWSASESAAWLNIAPISGTLPTTLTLTLDTTALTRTTWASLTLSTQWSRCQTETTTIPVLVMFVYDRQYLPLVTRSH